MCWAYNFETESAYELFCRSRCKLHANAFKYKNHEDTRRFCSASGSRHGCTLILHGYVQQRHQLGHTLQAIRSTIHYLSLQVEMCACCFSSTRQEVCEGGQNLLEVNCHCAVATTVMHHRRNKGRLRAYQHRAGIACSIVALCIC